MFTRVELTDWNTPRLFLMFYIHLHLLSIAFWKLWFNLTMESFKSSCIWKHPLFCWWFSSKTEAKNNDYYVQIFLSYLLIFSHWFLKSNQISSGIIFFFFTHFMKATFSQVRHPSHPGRGCGSLTCHMTHFEQSDWLRSPNLTNIMIEYRNWYQDWGHCCVINDLGSSPQPEGEARGLWWASQVVGDATMTEMEVSISILSWWNKINNK